jgi:polar amino acid transport system permease protein
VTGTRYACDFSILWSYRRLILTGLGVTMAYTIGTILLGLVVGLVTGLLRLSKDVLITAPLVAYVEVFRCTPLLVQIVWFYYALPVILGIDIPAHVAATLVLPLYTGAFIPRSSGAGSTPSSAASGTRHVRSECGARKSCAM